MTSRTAGRHLATIVRRFTRSRLLLTVTVIAAVVALFIALGGTARATPSAAARPAAAGAVVAVPVKLCGYRQHVRTWSEGVPYYIVNDPYGGSMCIGTIPGRPGFRVVSGRSGRPGHVYAFPFIMRGCSFSLCSPRSGFPRRISSPFVKRVRVSFCAAAHASGVWNMALELWVGRKASEAGGHSTGGELMVWMKHTAGIGVRTMATWTIDGRRYKFAGWRDTLGSVSWNYMQFRTVRQPGCLYRLNLEPFFARAEARGAIRPWWWLLGVEAGPETWSGGIGNAVTWFRVTS